MARSYSSQVRLGGRTPVELQNGISERLLVEFTSRRLIATIRLIRWTFENAVNKSICIYYRNPSNLFEGEAAMRFTGLQSKKCRSS